MEEHEISLFQETVWQHYAANGRHDLPWRQPEADGSFDPYKIFVSEMMLQQTQVPRVAPKYRQFLQAFPDVVSLSQASLGDVLRVWSGLGYNRRAKFLWEAARTAVREYDGKLPKTREQLVRLPGIGPNTAGAILAYAFNRPEIFIETNIRTVFIHHFFAEAEGVPDKDIKTVVAATMPDENNYREWYWALMDYGTHVKQTAGNASQRSKHFTRQSKFEGSRRQIRGKVLRLLAERPHSKPQLVKQMPDERLLAVVDDLQKEGFIAEVNGVFTLC